MIEVKNLVKKYGNQTAVDNLSFIVEKGEIVGFLGPNGAGKSTTMNIITGYIPATEGSILVDGHDLMEETKLVKQKIGYLPEVPPLYPDMRVKEYLHFCAELKHVDKKERKNMLDEIMEMTGIKEREGQLIKHLSKGYRQRTGLAAAIMGYPEIIILDEPTVGLDPAQIIEIRDLIKKLRREHTIILSSHILSEVSAVCDKVMIINKGKLIVSDTPDHLTERMQTSQTMELLVKGEETKVKEALEVIEGIEKIACKESGEGQLQINITGKGHEDIREKIFYALADAQAPILQMKPATMSLEDIFLEVTKEGQQETAETRQEEKEETQNVGDL